MSIIERASDYVRAGLCALPAIRAEKRPAVGSWKPYQTRLPTDSEWSNWAGGNPDAVCLICGQASGNLEVIDFDAGGALFPTWWDSLPEELAGRLAVETTQSGGRHAIYRCEIPVCGNLKLAQRNAGEAVVTLIETRGEGGLFLCAPTAGYEITQGDLLALPVLSESERDTLLRRAWELNEYAPVDTVVLPDSESSENRPGDEFNRRGDVPALLRRHGWSCVRDGENQYWRRPGKESGWSASLRDRVFYVFSANASPFQPNQGYSPFTVYTLLDHRGDFTAAARALCREGYGSDVVNDSGVELSGLLQFGTCDEVETAPEPLIDPGPLPDELLRIPGFISEVMDHCLDTAPYPNPVMAFGGALSLQAFLAGRKVRDPGDNRTNVYLLGLAHSAAGKDWPRKLNTRILHDIGLASCLGERFASGEGVQDAMFVTPSMLFQTDEIDGLLLSINKARDARHENIMTTLLTFYSSANSVFPMRRKAGKESPGAIDQPSLVMFGTAIPNHYYEALSERMLTNGFFARMTILECGRRGSGQEPRIRDVPERVLEAAAWWRDFQPGPGNLEAWHPVPAVVEQDDAARLLLLESRLEAEAEYERAEAENDAVGTTVWGRVSEQIRKLSLIYAVSEDRLSPRVGRDAAEWAVRFVMHQTRRMLFMASGHVARNDFDAMCKELLRVLREWKKKRGDDPMPEWEVNRRLPWKPRDHEDVRRALESQERVRYRVVPTKTQPKKLYWLLE